MSPTGARDAEAAAPAPAGSAPDPGALNDWLRTAEDFVAIEVVAFLSQFFVELRNLAFFLTVGPLLLLFAVTSYPFQPQRQLLVLIWALILGQVAGAVVVFVQMERDELISRISRTTPNRLNFHWGFLSNIFYYVVPLLGVLTAVSTEWSDLIHAWVDPIFQIVR